MSLLLKGEKSILDNSITATKTQNYELCLSWQGVAEEDQGTEKRE